MKIFKKEKEIGMRIGKYERLKIWRKRKKLRIKRKFLVEKIGRVVNINKVLEDFEMGIVLEEIGKRKMMGEKIVLKKKKVKGFWEGKEIRDYENNNRKEREIGRVKIGIFIDVMNEMENSVKC